jgi:DNA polymerase I
MNSAEEAALKTQMRLGSTLHDLINQGQDLHRRIAAIVLNKDPAEITKKERSGVKAISFGRPGGMGCEGLQRYAKSTFGQDLSLEEVEDRVAAYNQLCPELISFLEDEVNAGEVIADILDLTPAAYYAATIGFNQPFMSSPWPARKYGWLLLRAIKDETPVGFDEQPLSDLENEFFWERAQDLKKYLGAEFWDDLQSRRASEELWQAVRNCVSLRPVLTHTGRLRSKASFCAARNTIFQGLAADGTLSGLLRVWRAGHKIVAFVHDQIVVESPADDRVLDRKAEIERLMIGGMHEVIPGMNVKVETVITRSLDKRDLDPRYLN